MMKPSSILFFAGGTAIAAGIFRVLWTLTPLGEFFAVCISFAIVCGVFGNILLEMGR